ncbi:MAG: MFS transporter [Caldilineaceae bacterium]
MSTPSSSTVAPAQAVQKDVLHLPDFQYLLAARLCNALGGMGFATVIGYQLYELTKDPLSLGWLGLIQAIPALSLSLLGGHIADRGNRKLIVLTTAGSEAICMLLLMLIAMNVQQFGGVLAIYAVVFLIGFASGFLRPSSSAFEQQVIPLEQAAKGSSWMSSIWQIGAITGGPLAGFSIDRLGIPTTYLIIAILMGSALIFIALIPSRPSPPPVEGETIGQSLREGVKFVFASQALVGSMALDLFAVLFGGAMAMLPIFATDILHVGATGLGIMRTAPSIGALLVMLMATRRPPTHQAGRNLLLCVAGFGISMIVFGLSRNFVLSLVALFFSGVFDGVSMIVRDVVMRVLSPEHMRGRIAAVSWVFIGASNELGALESGVAARLLGTAPSVFWGGCVTMLVVGTVALTLPKLRQLRL